jgi:hypothetical protein
VLCEIRVRERIQGDHGFETFKWLVRQPRKIVGELRIPTARELFRTFGASFSKIP